MRGATLTRVAIFFRVPYGIPEALATLGHAPLRALSSSTT